MSDTPETDASRGYALSSHYGRIEGSYLQMDRSGPFVHAEVARKLERERDEARAELSLKCQSVTIASGTISDLLKKSERLEKQIEGLNNFANERFDEIQRVRRERDEAKAERDILRLEAQREAEHHDRMVGELEKVYKERDEARDAIPAGEWVAYEDHQKVHDAASRLLVAINKQLPIGCFILINTEYHRLQNAIYGKDEVK
jgi:chromosome segregation ATPase